MTGTGVGGTAAGVGLGDKIAGFAKEEAGKVTGNPDLERRGDVQQGKKPY